MKHAYIEYDSSRINEDWFEQVVVEHLVDNLGYEHLYGPDVRRSSDDYRDVFLPNVLPDALARINKGLPSAAIDEAILKISNVEGGTLEQRNETFNDYLQSGVEVRYFDGEQDRDEIVRLLDFDDPGNNDFHVVNQWTFVEYSEKRPDVIVFVNGMPLVMFELKSPSREETDASDAYKQLRQYMRQIPSMFVPNVFCVMSDMSETRVGTITADEDRFVAWKSVDGDYSETKAATWKTMLDGMLPKERLLDIVRNFVCFNNSNDRIVKILAAYHQYFGVRKAIERATKAVEGDGKIGVFWHTQGSGKSLSMVFFAHLLQSRLDSPTIVVITDRNDLDDQLYGQFGRCSAFLRQTPVQAESRKDLKDLLEGREANGIIFTTMQKFTDGDEPLCDRSNVVVMVDEAHRGQYGLTERMDASGKVSVGAARVVRKALPNASYIGFTGTPIALEDRNTREIFGDYIDVYDMTQSVEDESTKPVYYESRVVALHLDENALGRIDDAYREFADQADEATVQKSKHDLGGLDAIFDTPETIDALCRDIVEHYEENRADVLAGKALIVAYSRPIAMKIYKRIMELRPGWKDKVGVVMTMSNQDPEEWFEVCGGSKHKKDMEQRFKNDDDPLKIAIVVDMWLTGFDVPSLSTMYVFKPMKGYNLMQAIARVNRVCRGKEGGLVVDYIGIARALKQAMKDYTNRDQSNYGNMDVAATAYPKFLEKLDVCRDLMYGFDYRKLIFTEKKAELASAIAEGVDWLLEPKRQDDAEEFLKQCQLMNQALSLCKSLVSHEDQHEAAYLSVLRVQVLRLTGRKSGGSGGMTYAEFNKQVTEILQQTVHADGGSQPLRQPGRRDLPLRRGVPRRGCQHGGEERRRRKPEAPHQGARAGLPAHERGQGPEVQRHAPGHAQLLPQRHAHQRRGHRRTRQDGQGHDAGQDRCGEARAERRGDGLLRRHNQARGGQGLLRQRPARVHHAGAHRDPAEERHDRLAEEGERPCGHATRDQAPPTQVQVSSRGRRRRHGDGHGAVRALGRHEDLRIGAGNGT